MIGGGVVSKKIYTIDGVNFSDLESFYDEISSILIPDAQWGHNLDAFNDILRGGFGTPREGFIIIWKNTDISREALGYDLTIGFLTEPFQRITQGLSDTELEQREYKRLKDDPEINEEDISWLMDGFKIGYYNLKNRLESARQHEGQTIFDMLVEIIHQHPDIELRLE